MFIDFINKIISDVIGIDYALISITEISNRVQNIDSWEKLFFDFNLVSSLVVYFGIFAFLFYVLMYLPFKLFKRLIGQK